MSKFKFGLVKYEWLNVPKNKLIKEFIEFLFDNNLYSINYESYNSKESLACLYINKSDMCELITDFPDDKEEIQKQEKIIVEWIDTLPFDKNNAITLVFNLDYKEK